MRILPAQPNHKLTFTEQKVFSLLQATQWHPGSTCLSSLNLSEHEFKKWSEADFALVGPNGLLVIEVKGGAVSCNEGIWRYESSRFGPVVRRESPHSQANGAYHALADFVSEKFGDALPDGLGGFCVIFASVTRQQMQAFIDSPEIPGAITGYAEDLIDERTFLAFLGRVERYWATKNANGSRRRWTSAQCNQVAQALRPNFERLPPLNLRVAELREERIQLTQEQYFVLDHLGSSNRLLILGSAGCGKTFLATEAARREVAAGRRVLFVTGTSHLAAYLRTNDSEGLLGEVVAFSKLGSITDISERDVLIVDEGQQVTTRACLDVLEGFVRGGLELGRWRWFADPNRQVASDSAFEADSMELLRLLSTHEVPLLQNCRNPEQVVAFAEQVSGVSIGRPLVKGKGPAVDVQKVRHRQDLVERTAQVITKLLRGDARANEIVLLWGSRAGEEDAYRAAAQARTRLSAWRDAYCGSRANADDSVLESSVTEFRGLESEHVIILGLDDVTSDEELQRLLYLAVTRALYSATILLHPEAHERIGRAMQAALERRLAQSA
jgi:hypothetical protein